MSMTRADFFDRVMYETSVVTALRLMREADALGVLISTPAALATPKLEPASNATSTGAERSQPAVVAPALTPPKPHMARRRWTPEQAARAADMLDRGASMDEVARALGRTRRGIDDACRHGVIKCKFGPRAAALADKLARLSPEERERLARLNGSGERKDLPDCDTDPSPK
jgi:hypothetical protein